MRTYKGWSIERVAHNGMWSADQVGELPLMADTLAGLRDLIRHPQEVEAARRRIFG